MCLLSDYCSRTPSCPLQTHMSGSRQDDRAGLWSLISVTSELNLPLQFWFGYEEVCLSVCECISMWSVFIFVFLYLCLMNVQGIWSGYCFIPAPKNWMKMCTGIRSVHSMNSFDRKNYAGCETMSLIHVAIGWIDMKLVWDFHCAFGNPSTLAGIPVYYWLSFIVSLLTD